MARRGVSGIDILLLFPWWALLVLGTLTYFDLRFVVPVLPIEDMFLAAFARAAPGFAPFAAYFFLALAAISALRQWYRRRLLDGQSGVDSIRALDWQDFERLVGEAFRRQGYRVLETTGLGGSDGGVDLVLGKQGERYLVQCKQWKAWKVGVQTVRELYGSSRRRAQPAGSW